MQTYNILYVSSIDSDQIVFYIEETSSYGYNKNILDKIDGKTPFLIELNNEHECMFEGGGEYKEYDYLVVFNELGHRCGYVELPENHYIDGVLRSGDDQWEVIETALNVHGGITFTGNYTNPRPILGVKGDEIWLGFDCSHYGDNRDKKTALKYFSHRPEIVYLHGKPSLLPDSGVIRDYTYVEEQCKHLIEQLIEYDKQQ